MSPKSKTKPSTSSRTALPEAPLVYINDPSPDLHYARHLADRIPNCTLIELPNKELLGNTFGTFLDVLSVKVAAGEPYDGVLLLCESLPDSKVVEKINTVKLFQQEAIKTGRNIASINICSTESVTPEGKLSWGSNHVEIIMGTTSTKEVAHRLYKWLFTAFTVQETLHLIPEHEMLAVDKSFPDYQYCAIADNATRPKDAKVQFVALIVTRPVLNGQKLSWTVADRTGTASMYFQYRGEASQYTWDWCQALKVGERRALPRMPMVEIKERKRVRVAKAPIRTVALAVSGVGHVVRAVGQGVAKLGDMGKLGKSSEWVAKEDVVNGKKVDWEAVFEKERQEKVLRAQRAEKHTGAKVFNDNGEKVWIDDDSVASTTADGDEVVEEKVKDFV